MYDAQVLQNRLEELDSITRSTKYSKQKQAVKSELIAFLNTLSPPKSLDDAAPNDVRLFLAFKDLNGKTTVHTSACQSSSDNKFTKCDCPRRRSAGSIDSLIGQLRAIFRDHGRGSDWSDIIGLGNPAASPIIKRFLSAVRLEQSTAAVIPKRAVPLFLDKLTLVLRHIDYCQSNPSLSDCTRFAFLRDMAVLNVLAHSGDRAGDLGRILTNQIKYLPGNNGVVLNLCSGKTTDIRDPRVVTIYKSQSKEFCPVHTLERYSSHCSHTGIQLKGGYFFRPLSPKGHPDNKPLSSSALNERLKRYLCHLGIFEGETPHGTRGGCALTLTWLGLDSDSIMSHVGWKSEKMLRQYTHANDTYTRSKSVKAMCEYSPDSTKGVQSEVRQLTRSNECRPFVV